eukprot:scaffold4316_cov116-Isochrysis_galbana.AAC.2
MQQRAEGGLRCLAEDKNILCDERDGARTGGQAIARRAAVLPVLHPSVSSALGLAPAYRLLRRSSSTAAKAGRRSSPRRARRLPARRTRTHHGARSGPPRDQILHGRVEPVHGYE